jgi:hypothetical protein
MTTTTELIESESVCQASAASAIEPEIMLAHIFSMNNTVLITIDTVPSIYPACVLVIVNFISVFQDLTIPEKASYLNCAQRFL